MSAAESPSPYFLYAFVTLGAVEGQTGYEFGELLLG